MSTLLHPPEAAEVASAPQAVRFPWGLLLIAWCAFLFLYGVNRGDLYRNEGLRARVSQEMLASGDWIVPHLYGQPIFTKPPLMYWLICLCSAPFGEVTTATARLPSVLAAACLVLLFFRHFRRCLGRQAGYLAALLAPLATFWLERVPSAEIDALQVTWVAAAILFFLRALEAESCAAGQEASLRWWLLAGLCLAGGTLTKWTAPAFFYLTALTLLWWRGQWRLLFRKGHLLAATLATGLVTAWIGLAIAHTSATEFWNAVLAEAVPRLAPGARPRPYPWLQTLLHPAVILVAALPLSLGLFFGRESKSQVARQSERALLLWQALHCWLWPNLLFWSLHPDHTLRNRAPLYPAIAGIAVFALLAWQRSGGGAWRRPREWVAAFLVIWMALKVIHVEAVMRISTSHRGVRETAQRLASLLPADAVIYLLGFKDECLMFYLGLQGQRPPSGDNRPIKSDARFYILTIKEWLAGSRPGYLLAEFRDGQGDRAFLVEHR